MATFKKARHFKSQKQITGMKKMFPQFKANWKHKNDIRFIGELKPRENSPKYKVSIKFRGSLNPQVKVLKPNLVPDPPHIYKSTNTLCLYHPKNLKWHKDRLVAEYIVPLTAAWLYFYEVWLETDIWYGPEVKHGVNEKKPNE